MKYLLLTTIFLMSHFAKCQDFSEDSLELAQAVDWLEDKLTYNYYNVQDGEWWINRFTFNKGSETITIKNIAAPHPDAINDKTYLQLNFRLEELNPYTIQVQKNDRNMGRLVIGKTIRVGAYHADKVIKRVKHGRIASDQSFIYFSIPQFFEDSLDNYSTQIAEKLKTAIHLSTKIYPTEAPDKLLEKINFIMDDLYASESSRWDIFPIFNRTYEIDERDENGGLSGKRILRFSLDAKKVEMTSIQPGIPTKISMLALTSESGLVYRNDELSLKINTLNEFEFSNETGSQTFIRDGSADPKYR